LGELDPLRGSAVLARRSAPDPLDDMSDDSPTQTDLLEMLARCEAATPGPWKSFVEDRDHSSGSNVIQTGGDDIELTGATVADQDFIAHARQDVEVLAKELLRLRGGST